MLPAGLAPGLVRPTRAVFIVAVCLVLVGCIQKTDLPPLRAEANQFLDLIGIGGTLR